MCLWCLCKMNSEDGQVYSVYFNFLVLLSTTVYSQNIKKQNVNIADETLTDYTAFSVGITILNQKIIEKDYIEFVTEFPCLLGHPVYDRHRFPFSVHSFKVV